MKSSKLPCFLIFLCGLMSCSEKPKPGKQILITEGFSNKVLDAYWIYLPKNYSEERKWPMIMFLQGGDASASLNPNTVKDGGPAHYLLKKQTNLPDSFVIINPHMRTGTMEQRQWFQNADGLVQIINQAIEQNNVDPNRIYLTGQSRGGHGTWEVAKRFPEKFAAIVPIAGAITCKSNCEKITGLPMWIIHNNGDPVVDYEYPQATVNYLESKHGQSFLKISNLDDGEIKKSKSIFTTFYSDKHGGAGSKAYASPALYDWLLSNRKVQK